jgi:hypothetical protein
MATRSQELQLKTNDSFQRIEWSVQRFGWAVWALTILAGLIGLLGSGPLSHTETKAGDGSLTVAYDRYLHYHHPTQLQLTLGHIEDRQVRVKLSRPLLDCLQIERIEPEPAKAELTNDGLIYIFESVASKDARIIFHVDYERFGSNQGTIEVAGHEPVTLNQFVYP